MKPKLLISPGEILLEEFIEPLNITKNKLANMIGFPPNRITSIVNGDRKITTETSKILGKFFGVSDYFFYNLQRKYDCDLDTIKEFEDETYSSKLKDVAIAGKNFKKSASFPL